MRPGEPIADATIAPPVTPPKDPPGAPQAGLGAPLSRLRYRGHATTAASCPLLSFRGPQRAFGRGVAQLGSAHRSGR